MALEALNMAWTQRALGKGLQAQQDREDCEGDESHWFDRYCVDYLFN
jgi:hypothetical protein